MEQRQIVLLNYDELCEGAKERARKAYCKDHELYFRSLALAVIENKFKHLNEESGCFSRLIWANETPHVEQIKHEGVILSGIFIRPGRAPFFFFCTRGKIYTSANAGIVNKQFMRGRNEAERAALEELTQQHETSRIEDNLRRGNYKFTASGKLIPHHLHEGGTD